MAAPASNVTKLLLAWRAGDDAALNALTPMLYEQLHHIAAGYMRRERPNHTLSPTALVNEAYLRLHGAEISWQDRAHFLAIAAITMRRILVNHARDLQRSKRGSGASKMQIDEIVENSLATAQADPAGMIDLDLALTSFARQDARKARLLELIYFGGLTIEEAAEVLDISVPTVNRDLKLAKAWVRHALQQGPNHAVESAG
jgi:RNA polymerase sigma factor (TIGR02999 family)